MDDNGGLESEPELVREAEEVIASVAAAPSRVPRGAQNTSAYIELIISLVAVIGALALGLGITSYLRDHPYVFAYLVAYAGFRFADLLVRPPYDARVDRDYRWHRLGELPRLLLFAAAPFERTYMYGVEPPVWISALGLFVELVGLWLALGARIQLGRFGTPHLSVQEGQLVVRSGFYRYIRHPIYAGVLLALLGWPLVYGAPIVAVGMIVVGILAVERRIRIEEAMLEEKFGDMYSAYIRKTDRLVPGVW
jgi:protein-S-isoprenylcysteine O-methyltransferase Ste14